MKNRPQQSPLSPQPYSHQNIHAHTQGPFSQISRDADKSLGISADRSPHSFTNKHQLRPENQVDNCVGSNVPVSLRHPLTLTNHMAGIQSVQRPVTSSATPPHTDERMCNTSWTLPSPIYRVACSIPGRISDILFFWSFGGVSNTLGRF